MVSFDPRVAEWKSFATDTRYSLVERCLKMAQILEYPDLDISEYVAKLAALRESFRLDRVSGPDTVSRIVELGSHMFGTCGFRANIEDYYDPRNNFLNDVIDRRLGIAISISIVYIEIARGAGLEMSLVSFPGRVLVACDGRIIDPLAGGQILNEQDIRALLEDGGFADLAPGMLDPATPERILVRMAHNLKNSYMHSYAHEKALCCARIALALAESSAEDIRDAGLLEARLQDRDDALEHLNRYLEINPNGDDVDHILDIIRQMRSNR